MESPAKCVGLIPFREEWKKLLPLNVRAEQRVWRIADVGEDPGHSRPPPQVLHGDPSADIEKELSSFSSADGLRVNLFASEQEGLTSPLAIRWDPAGRMYVTVTTTYPHVFPGHLPNDKIIVLEDSDGKADKSSVFADVPTRAILAALNEAIGASAATPDYSEASQAKKSSTRTVQPATTSAASSTSPDFRTMIFERDR